MVMIAEHIDELEKKVAAFIKQANKRKKKAKKSKVKHYFEGQNDAFKQILIELKNLKYELETTVEEYEEFQTLDKDYTNFVSKTQRYKAIGNCWNVNTICHILKNIK